MNKILSSLAGICIALVFVKFQSLVDGPWMSFVGGVICPRASQTRCDTPFFWKRHSLLYLPFDLVRWWQRGWTGQQINSSGFSFRMECFIQSRGPMYPFWLVLRVEAVVIRCGMRSFPTVNCAQVHGWGWDGRWFRWLVWLGATIVVMLIRILLDHCHRC